ncbi:MAG: YkgJ family cysteine cluster protein [Candidatus Hodarchaeales archaeon]
MSEEEQINKEAELSEEKNDTKFSEKGETIEKKGESTSERPKKKYIFNCTKCGQCCEKREFVPVTITDLKIWTTTGVINAVFPHLKFRTYQTEDKNQYVSLVIQGGEGGCALFDKENRLCNIYHSMPLECKAFPLGYNGKNYYIKDKSVPGLGNGSMTKERLIEDRDNARADFQAKLENQMILPLLYSLFMQNLIDEQQKVMKNMPEEKRKQLEELLGAKQG